MKLKFLMVVALINILNRTKLLSRPDRTISDRLNGERENRFVLVRLLRWRKTHDHSRSGSDLRYSTTSIFS